MKTGSIEIQIEQGNTRRTVTLQKEGTITGVLPYSRMTEASGFGVCLRSTEIIKLHKSYFNEMINHHHSLTTALVHFMTSRVRSFTSLQKQNEKLMALGKPSAGLAHELNNPASAIIRSSQNLSDNLKNQPTSFKKLMSLQLNDEFVDRVSTLLEMKKNAGTVDLAMMAKTEKEDDLADYFEGLGVEDCYEIADVFVDYNFSVSDFETAFSNTSNEQLVSVLYWMENVLTVEKTVSEINDAANRISGLVKSVKTYTHMDRGAERELTDIQQGINSTLTMLGHKLRKKNIEVEKDFQENLPKIKAMVGELNQIWTNIIDNAIDALPEKGKLSIKTYQEGSNIKTDIEDNGPGIPSEIKDKIFEPFFTTKSVGEGTGLGLDIVKKIIDQHEGALFLDSVPGKTIFTICFPISKP